MPTVRSWLTSSVGGGPTATGTCGAPAGSGSATATHGLPAADGSAARCRAAAWSSRTAGSTSFELLSSLPSKKSAATEPSPSATTISTITTRTQGLVSALAERGGGFFGF